MLWGVVSELLNNCVQNKIPGSLESHANNVTVTFERGSVTVEDDFVYENPEQVLDIINGILKRGYGTTKTSIPGYGATLLGGAGLSFMVSFLPSVGGNVQYAIKDGTLMAIATWNPDKIKSFEE